MAVMNFDGFDPGRDGAYAQVRGGRGQRMAHLTGAALSLALIIGAGVWGYRIAVRDVSGVPVVRALEGPMRTAPDDPGGEEADNQGLSVNTVAADGFAAPVPEQLVLAPRPVDLTLEDGPGLAAEAPQVADAAAPADPAPAIAAVAETVPDGPEVLVEAAMSEALAAPEPLAEPQSEPVAADPALAGMRPMPRPTGTAEADVTAVVASDQPAVPDAAEIDPATLEPGTRLVQLGAFDDVETARAEWVRLAGMFGDIMGDKARVIQAVDSGGSSFVRLRAHGFADEEAARAFCTALIAKDLVCIPVAVQ
jgi:SPOR domain